MCRGEYFWSSFNNRQFRCDPSLHWGISDADDDVIQGWGTFFFHQGHFNFCNILCRPSLIIEHQSFWHFCRDKNTNKTLHPLYIKRPAKHSHTQLFVYLPFHDEKLSKIKWTECLLPISSCIMMIPLTTASISKSFLSFGDKREKETINER